MKIFVLMLIAFFSLFNCVAQKPPITFETFKTWAKVGNGGLSSDGKFAFYTIDKNKENGRLLVIKSTQSNWEKRIVNASDAYFTKDSKWLLAKLLNDSLLVLNLKANRSFILPNAKEFKLFNRGKKIGIIYLNEKHHLITLDLESEYPSNRIADHAAEFIINSTGSAVIVKKQLEDKRILLEWIDLNSKYSKIIYCGDTVGPIIFDRYSTQVAFLSKCKGLNELWYFKKYGKESVRLALDRQNGIDTALHIDARHFQFSGDAESIFFSLKTNTQEVDPSIKTGLRIWNYKDAFLPEEYYASDRSKSYLSVINIANKQVNQLLSGNEKLSSNILKYDTDSVVVIECSFGTESFIPSATKNYAICFTRNAKKIIFEKDRLKKISEVSISPQNNYVVYFDEDVKNYISYNIKTAVKINISKSIRQPLFQYGVLDYPNPHFLAAGVSGWESNEKFILINGMFDIWCVDPTGKKTPVSLTDGIGEKQNIVFTIPSDSPNRRFSIGKQIILTSLNLNNKKLGFYSAQPLKSKSCQMLSEISEYIYPIHILYYKTLGNRFLATEDDRNFLILKESATTAPNYFYSKDLKTFNAISDNEPQRKYNWLTSELHNYTDSSGNKLQGILYKPEDFNPSNSYPIIFIYYEKKSNLLNSFPPIELPLTAEMDASLPVSQGYLFFFADVKSKPRYTGKGALQSVLAAVKHLSQYRWVDTTKMGVVGHSFGGFETNYIITHSNVFKAAISGAGISEFISMAYGTWGGGRSMQVSNQTGQNKMVSSLSQDSKPYIENSALLKVKDVTTPLLLLHNSNDGAVPWTQSRQFFIALRSLQKPVWWLNYINESHGLSEERNQLDYNTKALEFLDHFLKNKSMPKWMNEAITNNKNF